MMGKRVCIHNITLAGSVMQIRWQLVIARNSPRNRFMNLMRKRQAGLRCGSSIFDKAQLARYWAVANICAS